MCGKKKARTTWCVRALVLLFEFVLFSRSAYWKEVLSFKLIGTKVNTFIK